MSLGEISFALDGLFSIKEEVVTTISELGRVIDVKHENHLAQTLKI